MNEWVIRQPDDWHVHLRDGVMMAAVVPFTARQCGRAIVMPNLVPPVTTVAQAASYRERILQALPEASQFEPLMTLYLTEQTTVAELAAAAQSPFIYAVKLYPAGATTNSDRGVRDPLSIDPLLAELERSGLPLLVHGEVVDGAVDIFDREAQFIERVLKPIMERFPRLKLVMEHITTQNAVDFVLSQPDNVGATITAHHLLYNRNALLVGGVHPHYYCLPVLKRESHRQALLSAATSGSFKFFMGTDSAPHTQANKESACGCAGAFTAYAALELYAEAFDQVGQLARLEAFTSLNGPRFYGLAPNEARIKLTRAAQTVPEFIPVGDSERLIPLRAGETLAWQAQRVE
ncbi:MAG: dihydroorotase [Halothiobacillus sp. 24-54-40]|jgi:dihydroorotase|nr:MAG: dihydroorotase [Halothiobacillus sp. 35-54-62]OYY53204.1 MAG: dihydroorotase [Halothiobacillus sp. 28-55-5]OYZ87082.1 MAG: dihydroorotase [Halothiobacillus sp. 24-54-40]OZA80596.1 MAG: dihydroorotase [Halothiobacillus sp. 39-53-45]HQS01645.1 dihydroorotase [Halothiobacillus sp.]